MTYARITGTGSFLPGAPITNTELIARHQLDSSDDWIVERTGIKARHLAGEGVTAAIWVVRHRVARWRRQDGKRPKSI